MIEVNELLVVSTSAIPNSYAYLTICDLLDIYFHVIYLKL